MCVVSMVADHYRDKWEATRWVQPFQVTWPTVTREEFDKLRADVDEMIALMKRAKKYDVDTGQPDCETDAKMSLLRKIAEVVGVDLDAALTRGQNA